LSILEANLTWLVIVDNSDSRFCIMSLQLRIRVNIIKLHKEVLIWLPVIIVFNSNVKSFAIFTIEFNYSIKSVKVFSSLGITINGCCSDFTSNFFLINDMNSQFTR